MFRRATAIVFTTFILAAALPAQSTFNQSIQGTVQDATGAVVPNATVTVTNAETNLTRSAVSNESGNTSFPICQSGSTMFPRPLPASRSLV
jgi:Carboxypeptidase regulatory-like domain